MIRFFRGMAWVRWRVLVNTVRGAWRRDTGERISRILGIVAPLVLLPTIVLMVLAAAVGGGVAGFALAGGGDPAEVARIVLRAVLFVVTVTVPLGPLVRSTQGAELNPTRLALLPVSRRVLHLSHLFGALGEPWLAGIVPALILLPLGMAAGGAPVAAVPALAAGALLLVGLAGLGALCTFALTLLFRDRRRAELFSIVAMGLMVVLALGFSLLERFVEGAPGEAGTPGVTIRFGDLTQAMAWLPSEAYASVVSAAPQVQTGRAASGLALLATFAVLMLVASGWTHGRVGAGSRGGSRRGAGRLKPGRWPAVPGLSRRASAVAWLHVRTVMRTVRGKLAVCFNFMMAVLVEFAIVRALVEQSGWHPPPGHGPTMFLVVFVFSLLSLQPLMLNMVAVDREGLGMLLTSPVGGEEIVRGKLFGTGLLTLFSSVACAVTVFLLAPGANPLPWLVGALAAWSTYCLFAPVGALLSIVLPRTADLGKLGAAGNPHQAAAMLGIVLAPLAAVPGGLAVVLPWVLGAGVGIAAGAALAWAGLAWLIGRGLTRLAVAAFEKRRENLHLVATGR